MAGAGTRRLLQRPPPSRLAGLLFRLLPPRRQAPFLEPPLLAPMFPSATSPPPPPSRLAFPSSASLPNRSAVLPPSSSELRLCASPAPPFRHGRLASAEPPSPAPSAPRVFPSPRQPGWNARLPLNPGGGHPETLKRPPGRRERVGKAAGRGATPARLPSPDRGARLQPPLLQHRAFLLSVPSASLLAGTDSVERLGSPPPLPPAAGRGLPGRHPGEGRARPGSSRARGAPVQPRAQPPCLSGCSCTSGGHASPGMMEGGKG